jgi:N-acetylneuraminate synthase
MQVPRGESSIKSSKIIAEIGLVHEGSIGLALSMARSAIVAGADIVKFQAHFPEFESSSSEKFRKHFSYQDKTRWDYWQRTGFTIDQWKLLKKDVESNGAKFAVSVFSAYAARVFMDMSVEYLKLGSGDFTNMELRESLQEFTGIVLLSCGMATWDEIDLAANWIRNSSASPNSAILQCTSMYPTPLNLVGLNVMLQIAERYGVPSGISDHTQGISSSLAALAYGASYIEKHYVLSHEMFGPDVSSSITPNELRTLCLFRDELGQILSDVDKDEISEKLSEIRHLFGRSLGLKRSFDIGEKPSLEDFCMRKPSGGLAWSERMLFVGKPLKRRYETNELISVDHFDMKDFDS